MVQADNSIAIYIDNALVEVIPSEKLDKGIPEPKKSNQMPAHARNIQPLIKGCIRYLVDMKSG